jgi:tagaturonate reductase
MYGIKAGKNNGCRVFIPSHEIPDAGMINKITMLSLEKSSGLAESINRGLERAMPMLTPLSIVLGFVFSGFFIHLRPYVSWFFGIMTFSGALKLRAAEFGATIRSPKPVLFFLAAAHIVMPLLALLAASLGFADQDIVSGFILLFAGPTAVSSFIWVTMYGGDKALCLTLILIDTVLAPLLVPGSLFILMGAKTVIDMSGIAFSLFMMIVVPVVLGVTVNEASKGKIPSVICPYLNPLSKICLMLVIAANTSAIAPRIQLNDPVVWKVALFCILLSSAGFVITKLAALAGKCGAEKSATMFFSGGLRNISAVTTIAVTFFPEAAALPPLLGIVFQQTIAALMGKLLVAKAKDA